MRGCAALVYTWPYATRTGTLIISTRAKYAASAACWPCAMPVASNTGWVNHQISMTNSDSDPSTTYDTCSQTPAKDVQRCTRRPAPQYRVERGH
jgi:hypothetical protein